METNNSFALLGEDEECPIPVESEEPFQVESPIAAYNSSCSNGKARFSDDLDTTASLEEQTEVQQGTEKGEHNEDGSDSDWDLDALTLHAKLGIIDHNDPRLLTFRNNSSDREASVPSLTTTSSHIVSDRLFPEPSFLQENRRSSMEPLCSNVANMALSTTASSENASLDEVITSPGHISDSTKSVSLSPTSKKNLRKKKLKQAKIAALASLNFPSYSLGYTTRSSVRADIGNSQNPLFQ